MVALKIFLSCTITLILFNMIFFLSGVTPTLLTWETVFGALITLGVIAVVVSVIPIADSETTMRWFMSSVFMVCMFYSVNVSVLTYNLTVGIGLVTRLTSLFSNNINSIGFIPYLFFTFIGLAGVITGIVAVGSSDA